MKMLLVTATTKYESVLDMFKKLVGTSMVDPLDKDHFMGELIKPLEIDPKAGELVFAELSQRGPVTADALMKYVEKYKESRKQKPKPRPTQEEKKVGAEPDEPEAQKGPEEKIQNLKRAEEKKDSPVTSPVRPKRRTTTAEPAEVKIDGVTFSPKEFAAFLETSNKFPLFNLADQLFFNENGIFP